jgi:hypothetical protein
LVWLFFVWCFGVGGFEAVRLPSPEEIELLRKGKQRQIIWIDIETFAMLIQLYVLHREDNIAMNDFIVAILRFFVNNKDVVERFEENFERYSGKVKTFYVREKKLGE